MKKRLILYLIIFQLIIIGGLLYGVYKKRTGVLGSVSVSPIEKESLVFNSTLELKNFYEPKPNTIIKYNYGPNPGAHSINSDSLNSEKEYSPKKPAGTFRIVALGDSFTYGLYVDTKDSWPIRLEALLNNRLNCENHKNFEVINLGFRGYDSAYIVERYKRRGQKYNPDLVIWLHVDLGRVNEYLRPIAERLGRETVKSGQTPALYEPWIKARREVLDKYGEEEVLKYQKKAIEGLDNYYVGKLLFALAPQGISTVEKTYLKQITQESQNKYYFDGLTDFYISDGAFPNDRHPNQKGYAIIALDLFNYLKDKRLITCD